VHPRTPCLGPALGLAAALACGGAATAHAQSAADTTQGPGLRAGDRLKPGAWEFGAGGSISNYSGTTYGSFEGRAGRFAGAGERGLIGFETLLGYTRLNQLNVGDGLLAVSYQWPLYLEGLTRERGATWPYFGVIGGVSQAWRSGFDDTRYPIGGFVGVRMMPNDHSAIRVEARFVSVTGASERTETRSGYFVVYSFRIVNPR
jgi:hypothetical protein